MDHSQAWIHLTTNHNDRWWGFVAHIYSTEIEESCVADEFACNMGLVCLDNSLVCDNHPQCLHGEDEHGCDVCGSSEEITLSKETGIVNLTSPLYPSPYPINLKCTWMVSINPNMLVAANIVYFSMENDVAFLRLRQNDDMIIQMTGENPLSSVIINGTGLLIEFDSNTRSNGFIGFSIYLKSDYIIECDVDEFDCPASPTSILCLYSHQRCDGRPTCPDEIDETNCGECGARNIYLNQNGQSTILQSPGYPREYKNDVICEWHAMTIGALVEIQILDFHMESGYDFLIIGEGDSKERNEIAKLTGYVKLKRITSKSSKVWIRLATDRTGQRKGFMIELTRTTEIKGSYSNYINTVNLYQALDRKINCF
ncbi:dorsal-ventral patterning protein tolloid-like [Amphiura filiformis]|uniref:dorsal-ventral patterning protein tolloid-like n=1 Tax=Amphiura filiformis TaxID=82378 RepID=UPI003B21A716